MVPPTSGRSPQGLIVILHGWGANAQDVAALATYLDLPHYLMAFPNAPFPHPHAPTGKMWYDIPTGSSFQFPPEFQNRQDVATSRQLLKEWLMAIADSSKIPLSRTILSGFSQGGAMTLDVGSSLPLAGLMSLSGYLHAPIQPQQPHIIPPVLMVHGRQDTVVPLVAAHQARDRLLALGTTVQYHEFEMGHEIQLTVLEQMQKFIAEVL
jgi:phospholipase/carboxylesterase